MCVHRIMAITSAFQADDAGSIPAARSNLFKLYTAKALSTPPQNYLLP
ncbi:hypothetical protein VCRA2122O12_40208 [Vibrio crassostreae]|nr:hypothetical protein VCRA2114E5_30226 [Vibrio crassostreae]CAK2086518.1 hypothetical protein VCRA2110O4_40206 [Vibrio crassostreae]CAK2092037.1 hypothetical protein VCRA2110O1_40210 [Vibrio crassostreae]CAK2870526.1 hypothetical protein VCRA2110O3_40205 [Vibrio crassostreae]CAK2968024.1 hypothetical protein VCRA2110O2_60223 [Vibrio crassostreae]